MDAVHLSKRLEAVAKFVPEGTRLADIGSDHAYLPANLLINQKISYAIAGEVAVGPYKNVLEEIERHRLGQVLEARLANGLAAITPIDEIDVVTIAGMGGHLIADILAADFKEDRHYATLILQPNTDVDLVRRWLMEHGYRLQEETMIYEDGHYYEVLVAVIGEMHLDEQALNFGPYNLERKPSIWREYWSKELKRREDITIQLIQKKKADTSAFEKYQKQIKAIKEALD